MMPIVNPDILVWARTTAGLTLDDAARKIGITDARGLAGADRLALLERGQQEPTRPVLVRMARQYRRPLLAFYLAAPPRTSYSGTDFRTLPDVPSAETDALVAVLVRNVCSRQKMVRATLEAEGEAVALPYVGMLSTKVGIGDAVAALGRLLGEDLEVAAYYAQPSHEQAFQLLRERAEAAGVFVLLKGDLGSHHTAIDADIFRGFAVADQIAPFVVINDNDARSAWSFTLLHELTHILLGETGISGGWYADHRVETFCNNVASGWLLPARVLDTIQIRGEPELPELQGRISEFGRSHNLGQTMVAYRLLRSDRIYRRTFEHLSRHLRDHWRKQRDRQRVAARASDGAPSYYALRRHQIGPALLGLVRCMTGAGALSTTRAARILGVKPRQVGKMIRTASDPRMLAERTTGYLRSAKA